MAAFGCCLWWFLLGALLGWLLDRLLGCFCRGKTGCGTRRSAAFVTGGGDGHSATHLSMSESSSPAPDSMLHRLITTRFYHTYHDDGTASAQTLSAAGGSAASGAIDVAAARAAGLTIKGPDDLTVVEGIGPKIAELLRARGINSFAELAGATPEGIQEILHAAGPKFKLAVPQTWPEQAALALQNRWAELKALQDKLVAGARPVD